MGITQRPWIRREGGGIVEIARVATAVVVARDSNPGRTDVRPPVMQPKPPRESELPQVITDSIGMKLVLIPAGEFLMGSSESPEQLYRFFESPHHTPDEVRYLFEGGESPRWVIDNLSGTSEFHFRAEQPQHRVHITKSFYLGMYEVTVGQFRQFVQATEYRTDAERRRERATWRNPDFVQETWRDPDFVWSDDHPVVFVSWNDADEFCKWLSGLERRQYGLPTEAQWEYACRAGTNSQFNCGDQVDKVPFLLVSVGKRYFIANQGRKARPEAVKMRREMGNRE